MQHNHCNQREAEILFLAPQSERSEDEEGMKKRQNLGGGEEPRATMAGRHPNRYNKNNENKYCIRLNVFIE